MSRFTVFFRWPDGIGEELDVDATSRKAARAKAEAEARDLFTPGWRVERVEERFGLYM